MIQPSLLFIDANALGYAAMYQPELAQRRHKEQLTSALYGVPKSVFGIIMRHRSAYPVLLWDGSANWRKTVYPAYKSNRDDDPVRKLTRDDYRRQADILRVLFADMGILQIHCQDSEADDLAGHLCRRLSGNARITLITSDTDWWQCVSKHVTWESRDGSRRVTLSNFNKETGTRDPAEYVLCKAIAGDSADNIKGVCGIGISKAKGALDKFGSLENLCEAVQTEQKSTKGKKGLLAIASGMDIIARNRKIMDLRFSRPVHKDTVLMSGKFPAGDLYVEHGLAVIQKIKSGSLIPETPKYVIDLVSEALNKSKSQNHLAVA